MMFFRKRQRERTRRTKQQWKQRGKQAFRIALMLALLGVLTVLFPTQQQYEYSAFREGAIAPDEVIASESFTVYKSEEEYQNEVAEARLQILPVLRYDSTVEKSKLDAFKTFLNDTKKHTGSRLSESLSHELRLSHPEISPLSESTLRYLIPVSRRRSSSHSKLTTAVEKILQSTYQNGILDQEINTVEEGYAEVILLNNGSERQISLEELVDIENFTSGLQQTIEQQVPKASAMEMRAGSELVLAYLSPNIAYDATETQRRRDEAASNVQRAKPGTVLKGERIIDKHDRITSDDIDKLRSLAEHINQRRQQDPFIDLIQRGAGLSLCALTLIIFFAFLKFYRPDLYRPSKNIVLFGIIILIPTAVADYAAQSQAISPFLIPVALSAMLATVLFDAVIGMVITLVVTTLCASILGELQYGIIFLTTGIIGAFSVHQVRHRRDFYRPGLYLIAAYALTITSTVGLLFSYANTTEFLTEIREDLFWGILSACGSLILTIGLLPVFESVFNVVTSMTLLELADLNRPLLRNLAIRAPGTFSHSINMANISEEAAVAIGADPLLARVGCYYHDIGKMRRPHYFIENQHGVNPHDELQPQISALILISHVRDGIELAKEEGLPLAIIDLIPQHHGTSEMTSFKHQAQLTDEQAVRDADFHYPGPKPQTKEAGIINLADAVESATRSLPNNDPDEIRELVHTIVKGRYDAGELDECDLTLRDLTRIQEAFLPVLQASHHHRVPYPWQVQQQERQSASG